MKFGVPILNILNEASKPKDETEWTSKGIRQV
jgi:hypothetical protein